MADLPRKAIKGNSESFYLPQLDGLRFLAFFSVFVWHFMTPCVRGFVANPQHTGLAKIAVQSLVVGGNGVDLFFTLSAYLITELLLRERRTYGSIAAKSFYVRRALRIWPLYYGVLILILVCASLLPALAANHNYLPWYFLFAGNFALCKWGPPAMILSPLWSVSVEEQFYFLWPLMIRHLSRRRIIHAALAMWAIGIAFRICVHGAPNSAIAYNTIARLDPIAAGILLAAVLDGRAHFNSRFKPWTFAAAGLILYDFSFLTVLSRSWAAESLIALGSAAFVVAAIENGHNGFIACEPLVYLGRISYGLYIFHGAVIMAGCAIFGTPSGFSIGFLMAAELAATIAIAAASYQWVEQPFLRLKSRFQRVASGADFESAVSAHNNRAAGTARAHEASLAH